MKNQKTAEQIAEEQSLFPVFKWLIIAVALLCGFGWITMTLWSMLGAVGIGLSAGQIIMLVILSNMWSSK